MSYPAGLHQPPHPSLVDKVSITVVIINEVRLCAHELPCWAAPTPPPLPLLTRSALGWTFCQHQAHERCL